MSILVQKQAPPFTAAAVMPDNTFDESFSLERFRGRYVVLFFWPFDFTFVCPSEILAFDHQVEAFKERECEVVGASVDSLHTHLAWKNTAVEDGGIGPVRFPLVGDFSKQIARDFGILVNDTFALRATFLIDREGIVRHQVVNDLDLGRNIAETLRTLDALRHVETHGDVCPANWEEGRETMQATPAGVKKFLKDFSLDL